MKQLVCRPNMQVRELMSVISVSSVEALDLSIAQAGGRPIVQPVLKGSGNSPPPVHGGILDVWLWYEPAPRRHAPVRSGLLRGVVISVPYKPMKLFQHEVTGG